MSRRLNDVRAVAWGYISGPLSRNDVRAVAAWDCVNRSMSGGLYNDLRMSRAYEPTSPLLELFASQHISALSARFLRNAR